MLIEWESAGHFETLWYVNIRCPVRKASVFLYMKPIPEAAIPSSTPHFRVLLRNHLAFMIYESPNIDEQYGI
jgi:hypothetical protein